MSPRNIRAHQSRGLLPSPEIRHRTAYYGDGHVERLGLIQELQAEGFNLEAIRRLLEDGGSDAAVRFTRAVREPFAPQDSAGRLAAAGQALAELGIAQATSREVAAEARRHAEGVAQAYVDLFLREVWEPFDRAGRPRERWHEVADALDKLRPLASEVLLALLGQAMTEATEQAIGRQMRDDGRMPASSSAA